MASFRIKSWLAGSILLLAACVTEPRYDAPSTGSSLSFIQNIEPLRASSRVIATISIQRADAAGNFMPVGQLSGDMLSTTTLLVPGVPHLIIANFNIQSIGASGRLSDVLTITPSGDENYQAAISYLDTGYGIRLLR
jgi:hypothetical protein